MPNWNYESWLDQILPVSYEENLSRRYYISAFTDELRSFMKWHGYVLDARWTSGTVAHWMYTLDCSYDILNVHPYPEILHRSWPEDKEEFRDTINDTHVDEFFQRWSHIADFDKDTFLGRAVRDEMQNFLWVYIDLEQSPRGISVSNWLEGSDDESDGGKKVDIYLQDVAAGYHGTV